MTQAHSSYIEQDTPWWSPDWVRDNPEKAAPALPEHPDEYLTKGFLTD